MYIGDFVAFLRTPLRQNARLKAAVWHTEDTNPGRHHHHHQLKNRAHESWKRQFASNNMSWPPFWRNVGRYGIDAVYVYAGLLRCGRRSKMEEAIFTRRGCRCLKYLIKFSENASFICFWSQNTWLWIYLKVPYLKWEIMLRTTSSSKHR